MKKLASAEAVLEEEETYWKLVVEKLAYKKRPPHTTEVTQSHHTESSPARIDTETATGARSVAGLP